MTFKISPQKSKQHSRNEFGARKKWKRKKFHTTLTRISKPLSYINKTIVRVFLYFFPGVAAHRTFGSASNVSHSAVLDFRFFLVILLWGKWLWGQWCASYLQRVDTKFFTVSETNSLKLLEESVKHLERTGSRKFIVIWLMQMRSLMRKTLRSTSLCLGVINKTSFQIFEKRNFLSEN